jgi:hypothetical protein
MQWRMWGGWLMVAGVVLLVWDLFAIGSGETRKAWSAGEGPAHAVG